MYASMFGGCAMVAARSFTLELPLSWPIIYYHAYNFSTVCVGLQIWYLRRFESFLYHLELMPLADCEASDERFRI